MPKDKQPRDLTTIQSQQDQDIMGGKEWWRSNRDQAKLIVWQYIQSPSKTAVEEVVKRFAQIGYTQIMLEEEQTQIMLEEEQTQLQRKAHDA